MGEGRVTHDPMPGASAQSSCASTDPGEYILATVDYMNLCQQSDVSAI